MTLPPLPKKSRSFLCTKCGSRKCKGSIEIQYPQCSNCGYLGFADDNDHTDEAMEAYGIVCRNAALEEAANRAEDYPKYGEAIAEEIRSLK